MSDNNYCPIIIIVHGTIIRVLRYNVKVTAAGSYSSVLGVDAISQDSVLSHEMLSHEVLSHEVLSHEMSFHEVSFHEMSSHEMSFHEVSFHETSAWFVESRSGLRHRCGLAHLGY